VERLARPWSVRLVAVTAVLRNPADFPASAPVNDAMGKLRAAGTRAGLFFDFDGVLSRIQDDPESVWPLPGIAELLAELRAGMGMVALVSSRNAAFLHSRLGTVDGLEFHGLYGLEHIGPDGSTVVLTEAGEWITRARALCAAAVRELPGVYVEDKKLSVGLHYRLAPHTRGAVEEWARLAAERTGFRVQPGRMAVELKPPLDVDKGTTLTRLITGLDAAWFFGDDLADLPAFAALHERSAADDGFSGLAVGIGNDTVVDDVKAASDVFVESPELLVEFLRFLRDRLAE